MNNVGHLQPRMKSVGDPESSIASLLRTKGSDDWETWSLAESMRGTVIVGYCLYGLYSFLKIS